MKRLVVVIVPFALLVACSPLNSREPARTPAASATVAAKTRIVEVAHGLEVPWSIAFAPDGRILLNERAGRVRVIENGALRSEPLYTVPGVSSRSEEGLMGLVLHPRFSDNRLLYLSYAIQDKGAMVVKVVRFRETGTSLVEPKVVIAGIPAARFHAGCRLKFGPDGKLYITTGDATERDLAQKLDSLAGKILRLNDDGTIPADNPIPNSPIFTLGHRNPQGIDWHPVSGLLYSTEHGPSLFDGPPGGDEVNLVERGKNYGWPVIHHRQTKEGYEAPIAEYTPAHAPGSAAFYRGSNSAMRGSYFFGCLRGEHLHRLVFDRKIPRVVVEEELLVRDLGRIREVAYGPDGALYFSTSNRDGRGSPAKQDDRVFKLLFE